MRVISQNGTIDVPYENFVFSILNSSGGNYGIVAVKNVAEPPELFMNSLIATYSTEAKAIKAMEMLRKQYKRLETLKLYTKGSHEDIREILTLDEVGCTILKTRKLSVFQFPQDDEIEV